jgi:hypothetical protein
MGSYLMPPRTPNAKLTVVKRNGKKGLTQVTALRLDSIPDPNSRTTIEVGARFKTDVYRSWVIVGVEEWEVIAVSVTTGVVICLTPTDAAKRFNESNRVRPTEKIR